MAERRTPALLLDGRWRRRAPQPPAAVEERLVVVAGDLSPRADGEVILDALGGRAALRSRRTALRVVALPPRRPFDWTAVAWADAASPDGSLWPLVEATERDAFDLGAAGAQLLLGELLDHLRRAGTDATGWVDDRRSVLAALAAGVTAKAGGAGGAGEGRRRSRRGSGAVLLLCGPGRWRPPRPLLRLVARRASGSATAVTIVRTARHR